MSNGSVNFTSLTEGTLNPDSRVNYNFGLVLGVNEFRQEQLYFLDKHYLHNGELHGYGAVTGLSVDAARFPKDKPTDVEVTVHPGMAIDQLGRPLIVREDQCARLGAWLAQQVKNDQKNNKDTFEDHSPDEDGYLTVFVVASYAEREEQSVPVAGGLAGNGNSAGTYSRIRDSFTIEFRWDRPKMPAWDAVRKFAAVLDRVHIAESGMGEKKGKSDRNEDEDERIEQIIEDICKEVRRIGELASPQKKQPASGHARRHRSHELFEDEDAGRSWYLPAKVFQYALDRIFIVWVTEVRPKLLPNLIDAQATPSNQEAGILLARIDFQPEDPFNADKPVVRHAEEPENAGRPFLLSTQVLQELVAAGGSDSHPPREFATLQTRTNRTLQAWIHHPAPIRFRRDQDDWNEMLELKCNGRRLSIADVRPVRLPDMKNVIELSINADDNDPSSMISPGARVELTFKLHKFRIRGEDEDGKKPEDSGLVGGVEDIGKGLEKGGKDVEKGEIIEGAERAVGGILHGAEDVVEGAVKGVEDVGKGLVRGVEDVGEELEKAGKAALKGHIIKGIEDVVTGAAEGAEDIVEGAAKGVGDVLGVPEEEEDERNSLRGSIDDFDIEYVGYDRVANTITVYTIADHWPSRELVTLYLYNPQVASVRQEHPASMLAEAVGAETTLHLWFHTQKPVKLPESCQVMVPLSFTEPPQAITFTATPPPGHSYSYFWALVPPAGIPLQPGELLTVELNTDQILVQGRDKSGPYGGNGGSKEGNDLTNTGAAGESADITNTGAAGESADITNIGSSGPDVTDIPADDTSDDVTNIDNDGRNTITSGDGDGNGDSNGEDDGGQTLTDVIKGLPYNFVGYNGDHTIIAHHQVPFTMQTVIEVGERQEGREREEREAREERQRRPIMPFVTITHLSGQGEEQGETTNESFELWFHLVPDPNDEIASFNEGISCEVSAELSDLRRSGRVDISNTTSLQLNVYVISVTLPQPTANQQAFYLHFKFPLAANPVSVRRGQFFPSLAEYTESRGIAFEGFNGRDAIVAYARIPIRERRNQSA